MIHLMNLAKHRAMSEIEHKVSYEITGVWAIDRVESYWYWSGRNDLTYKEVTFWFDPTTCERKETVRAESCCLGDKWKLPEWAKCITAHNKGQDYEYV